MFLCGGSEAIKNYCCGCVGAWLENVPGILNVLVLIRTEIDKGEMIVGSRCIWRWGYVCLCKKEVRGKGCQI